VGKIKNCKKKITMFCQPVIFVIKITKMKYCLSLIVSLVIVFSAAGQGKLNKIDSTKKILAVEASCGQCNFGLKAKGCQLAVRIDGKAYFVDGTTIDDHGDAHAEDGFCEVIKKANVQGEIVENRFKATYFRLLPAPAKKD
jgi:hypothetical protein